MKTTIAGAALAASTSVFGFRGPVEVKTVCLNTYEYEGKTYTDSCDSTYNNQSEGVEILANGCAEGQVSIKAQRVERNYGAVDNKGNKAAVLVTEWSPNVEACMPVNIVQL